MKRLVLAVMAISAAAAGSAGGPAVRAARAAVPAAGLWGRAIEVPGLGALNKGGYAQVTSLSCASAGSCAAGGFYVDRSGYQHRFVAAERRGVWGRAIEVPGLRASGGVVGVDSVSCASAGNCAAGGYYVDRSSNPQGFVVAERDGAWAKAIEVPGLGALNKNQDNGYGAEVTSVSCASAGNCSYGGWYQDRHGTQQGFVAGERNGRWGKAIEVPGLGALNTGGADVSSVSCASAGDCTAGGSYDGRGSGGYAVAERNGRWGKAIQIPGLAALGGGDVSSVSCASPGNCAAGGTYVVGPPIRILGFVADERNGRWGKAIKVPGRPGARNAGEVSSVSCASPGNCAAGGGFGDGGFAVAERNGRWGKAIQVPGLAALNKGSTQPFSQATYDPVVSCAPAGTCAAGGAYTDASEHAQGFVTQTR